MTETISSYSNYGVHHQFIPAIEDLRSPGWCRHPARSNHVEWEYQTFKFSEFSDRRMPTADPSWERWHHQICPYLGEGVGSPYHV